jgi:hypothetical protein|uniref:Outer membrane protein beta-barrel domain-containing protein n=1 Tax=candidate division WOR-3 bacterium TaxID=2052148 RepID=A0A7V3RG76_UNCW3
MIILFLINSLTFYLGLRFDYCQISDFNEHFEYLNNRAHHLGWSGKFSRFHNLLYAPVIELDYFTIENFSTSFSLSWFWDKNNGEFIYTNSTEILRLNETWDYWTLPFDLKFKLNTGSFIFTSGFTISIARLNINVNGNYEINEEYPMQFTSDDVGLFISLIKRFGRLAFEISYNYMEIDQFHNKRGYLYFDPDEKYIYLGPPHHRNPSAVLSHSGLGLRYQYLIFR